MGSKAADKQVHAHVETTSVMESLPTDKGGNAPSLPSPPSSVNATQSDGGRNENGWHSGETAGGELSVIGSSADAHRGANADGTRLEILMGLQANCSNRC